MKTYTAKQAVSFFLKHAATVSPEAVVHVDFLEGHDESELESAPIKSKEALELLTACDECRVYLKTAEGEHIAVFYIVLESTFTDRAEVVCDYGLNPIADQIHENMMCQKLDS